ncbi:hypothetical protein AAFF_G00305640 [Aldrovandia affinis]|uniref:Uncharacterized protein n=1 Tax=Aldrovandia affinis TaxID=143900 RepID=A0AAD7WRH7_9TELE|nr:hypothetical protein AAFF_G00305640 [Aldrovandia affinis]
MRSDRTTAPELFCRGSALLGESCWQSANGGTRSPPKTDKSKSHPPSTATHVNYAVVIIYHYRKELGVAVSFIDAWVSAPPCPSESRRPRAVRGEGCSRGLL